IEVLGERNNAHAADAGGKQTIHIFNGKPGIVQRAARALRHNLVLCLMGGPSQWMFIDPLHSSFSFNVHKFSLEYIRGSRIVFTHHVLRSAWCASIACLTFLGNSQSRRTLPAVFRSAASVRIAGSQPAWRREYARAATRSAPPACSDRL